MNMGFGRMCVYGGGGVEATPAPMKNKTFKAQISMTLLILSIGL